MADRFEFIVEGGEEIIANLKAIGADLKIYAGGALYEEGSAIMEVSQGVVPVSSGYLKASGWVHDPEVEGDNVVVMLSYGGPAGGHPGSRDVGYAVLQHETPPSVWTHSEGQSWKYLQRPAEEATRGMGARIASSIKGRLERRR